MCLERYNIKNKKEFVECIKRFEDPCLKEGSERNDMSTLNAWFIILDRKKISISMTLPGCRMSFSTVSSTRFGQKDIDSYYNREEKLRSKYTRWLNEALELRQAIE